MNQTALHMASFEGDIQIVMALLDAIAEVDAIDAEDANGHTPLMLASLRGHVGVMELLIAAGADCG